jgi:leucyl aminopeptidase (aminopeptidase T)
VLNSPLALSVQNDKVVKVEGEHASDFEAICKARGDVLHYISEISMGMNPGGILTQNPQFIPEDKNFGTLHCGHGGNASYGSRIGPHLDGVMDRPSVWIDGVQVMDHGRLAPNYLPAELDYWLREYARS